MSVFGIIDVVIFFILIFEVFAFGITGELSWGHREKKYDGEFIINDDPEIDDIFKLELEDENIYDKDELLIKVVKKNKED